MPRKTTITMIHQGYSTLDIVSEIQNKFDILGDEAERGLYVQVGRLRKEIQEARACAQEAAEEAFRQHKTWKEVIAILECPGLLSPPEVVGYASRAQDAVKAEQE